jgi:hypothetical protein
VREEAQAVMMAPLAIMPPPRSEASGGASLKSIAKTRAPQGGAKLRQAPPLGPSSCGVKRKAPESAAAQKSARVTPLGNTIFSRSYMVVGVEKPEGGYGMALLCKGKWPTVSRTPKPVSKETAGSSSRTLRPCAIFERDEEQPKPKGPTLTKVSDRITTLIGHVRDL